MEEDLGFDRRRRSPRDSFEVEQVQKMVRFSRCGFALRKTKYGDGGCVVSRENNRHVYGKYMECVVKGG